MKTKPKNKRGVFYNTIHESGKQLSDSIKQATTQEEKVLRFFKTNPKKLFTPFDIKYVGLFEDNVPLTSIRRAITNLEGKGLLEKTEEKREGGYGKYNYCWKLFVPKKKKKTKKRSIAA